MENYPYNKDMLALGVKGLPDISSMDQELFIYIVSLTVCVDRNIDGQGNVGYNPLLLEGKLGSSLSNDTLL